MIASLRGRLIHKGATDVVVDCGGVGYGVTMSLTALDRLGSEGAEVQLLIYTHVAAEVLRLYGFLDPTEKRFFEILIGISGVGPKLALAILSTLTTGELNEAILRADIKLLVRVPGVGRKTAERLVLELKDRLPKLGLDAATPVTDLRGDLESALVDLGFGTAAADKAADAALAEHGEVTDIAVLVRAALRASTKR